MSSVSFRSFRDFVRQLEFQVFPQRFISGFRRPEVSELAWLLLLLFWQEVQVDNTASADHTVSEWAVYPRLTSKRSVRELLHCLFVDSFVYSR
jgi:hypothetical protein